MVLNLFLNYCVPRASPFSSLYLTGPHKTDLILAAVRGCSIFMKNYNFSGEKKYHLKGPTSFLDNNKNDAVVIYVMWRVHAFVGLSKLFPSDWCFQ